MYFRQFFLVCESCRLKFSFPDFCFLQRTIMSDNISEEQNRETIDRLRSNLKRKGDEKCYCPCKICKGLNRRRLLIKTVKRPCRENGHIEKGHDYHPLVSCSLYHFNNLYTYEIT